MVATSALSNLAKADYSAAYVFAWKGAAPADAARIPVPELIFKNTGGQVDMKMTTSFSGGVNFTMPHLNIFGSTDTVGHVTRLVLGGATGSQCYIQSHNEAGSASSLSFWTRPGAMAEAIRIDSAGNLGIGTASPSCKLDVADNRLRVRAAKTPASATATGSAGEMCWDSSYIYVCVATNTWKRAALVSW